ncbi:MAG TPA: hypothetical protein VJN89_16980 [Candidatus Acidoferrum sp.]|nr:hypothetical protein [Candidatus Acidoferrum sp.]
MTLDDLAHFKIKSISPKANRTLELAGVFTDLKGVRLSEDTDRTVGFLYISRKDSVYLLRREFDANSKSATLIAWPPPSKPLREGSSYPYVDYYWSPKEVAFALEPASSWKRVKFKAEDSVRFRDPKVPGWWTSQVASTPVAQGATHIHIIKNGWDCEHCYVCKSRIGKSGNPWGYYSKADNDWLCISCFKKFIARHDLRFLQFEK